MSWTFCRETDAGLIYPFDLADLRAAGIAAHDRSDPRSLARYGVHHVHRDPEPDPPFGRVCDRDLVPQREGGLYRLGWTERDMTEQEWTAWREEATAARADFAIALAEAQIITGAEAEAWAGGSALPELAVNAIAASGLSVTAQVAARIRALGASEVRRLNPIVAMLQAAVPLTDQEADSLFHAALSIG